MKKNKGIFLPLVLILLVVLAILGVFMNKSAMHEYRYTYRSADHQRALYVAQGAIQSMLGNIKEEMNKDSDIRKVFVTDAATKDFVKNLGADYQQAIKEMEDSLNASENSAVTDP
ncbi:MAG: hypothetical protein PHQ23_13445, partial [Candidatus Wallbacteria bacterium]|nr:hypothetical protein [Candidatus Wallbacteria bacterium]